MQEFYKRFRELTGYKGTDVASMVGVSREHISNLTRKNGASSITHRSAIAMWMTIMIEQKMDELEQHIMALDMLQAEIKTDLVSTVNNQLKEAQESAS